MENKIVFLIILIIALWLLLSEGGRNAIRDFIDNIRS